MAKFEQVIPKFDVEITFRINEAEARLFLLLAHHGAEFYTDLLSKGFSPGLFKQHELGLRSLLNSVSPQLGPILRRTDDARQAFLKGTENQ